MACKAVFASAILVGAGVCWVLYRPVEECTATVSDSNLDLFGDFALAMCVQCIFLYSIGASHSASLGHFAPLGARSPESESHCVFQLAPKQFQTDLCRDKARIRGLFLKHKKTGNPLAWDSV